MPNAVFTTSESSAYDDQPEERYHFPGTYLNQVRAALGELVVYYEPRRTSGPGSATGRQSYFAIAEVTDITADPERSNHYYARMSNYLEFDAPVPFSLDGHYFESVLKRSDGKTNKGAFGRAVRNIPSAEFRNIVQIGFSSSLNPPEWSVQRQTDQIHDLPPEEVAAFVDRPIIEQIVNRRFRDVAFRHHVRTAYNNTCAVTGLRLINGGGRPEVQAAHIRPVEQNGPDTVRNGLALTGTAHWLFDRGLISIADDYRILLSPQGVPEDLHKLIRPEHSLWVPDNVAYRPHATYLRWHRDNCFKA
jgi:putative restriction endonuclease